MPEPFFDIQEKVVSGGEQGLLSVAFHPDYAQNRLFYVDYTDTRGDTVVEEYRARDGAAPERVRELLHVDQPYSNHNGGQLAFGPDGLLYVGMGDGGAAGDPENRAQDLDDRLGKSPRVDVDRDGAEWELVGYGLRNPWRFSFDRETGDLWIGDVGQGDLEEVDFLPAGSRGLVNFGWDVFEGSQVYEDKEPNPAGRLVGPIAEYSHAEGCSVTGGFVYRGEDVPAASGRYFYGDYCSGFVWSLVERRGQASARAPGPVRGPRALLLRRGRARRALPRLPRRSGLPARLPVAARNLRGRAGVKGVQWRTGHWRNRGLSQRRRRATPEPSKPSSRSTRRSRSEPRT